MITGKRREPLLKLLEYLAAGTVRSRRHS